MYRTTSTRIPTVAGQFYDKDSDKLKDTIKKFLENAKDFSKKFQKNTVRAIIVPHAGYTYSGKTAAITMSTAANKKYKRIIVIAPSHYVGFEGVALPSYSKCQTPIGDIPVDLEALKQIPHNSTFINNEKAHTFEHSLEVELPLIKYLFPETPVLPLVCGRVDDSMIKKIIEALYQFWDNDTFWVISSDFTHYGQSFQYVPFTDYIPKNLEKLDKGAIEQILELNPSAFMNYIDRTGATICGKFPIFVLLSIAKYAKDKGEKLKTSLVEYTTSGKLTGDYSHTVSYAGINVYI